MTDYNKNKINWRSYINIGTVVFLLIIIYLAGTVFRYISRKEPAVYEVSNSEISDTIKGTGIILREEQVYTTTEDGYINAYLSDGDRVKANGIVYTLDKTGKIQEEVNRLAKKNSDSNTLELSKILEDLRSFTDAYDDADFYTASETSNELDHDLNSYTGTLLSKYKKRLEKKYGEDCYVEVRSEKSGLVSYSSDGLESITVDDMSPELFNNKVHMDDLRTKEETEKGTSAYRLTSSQSWSIVVPLSADDYSRLKNMEKKGTEKVDITIEKDEFELKVPFRCFEKDDQGYVELTIKDYVQRYLNYRYLSVQILLVQSSGLKIPASALVERTAFRIPTEYLCEGSNSETRDHVNLIYRDKDGKQKVKQITVKVFDEEEGMVSIFSTELAKGDRIKKVDEASTFSLDKEITVYGVYTVNAGYAVYSYVTITERNEDYCIVDEGDSEIQLYDRIVLNSNTIQENEIIY